MARKFYEDLVREDPSLAASFLFLVLTQPLPLDFGRQPTERDKRIVANVSGHFLPRDRTINLIVEKRVANRIREAAEGAIRKPLTRNDLEAVKEARENSKMKPQLDGLYEDLAPKFFSVLQACLLCLL